MYLFKYHKAIFAQFHVHSFTQEIEVLQLSVHKCVEGMFSKDTTASKVTLSHTHVKDTAVFCHRRVAQKQFLTFKLVNS